MARLEKFMGQDLEVPEDRLYSPGQHLWVRSVDSLEGEVDTVEVGISAPGVALTGGLVDVEVLVDPGCSLLVEQEAAFATTCKGIKYFLSPLQGTVTEVNRDFAAAIANERPYVAWLFRAALAPAWKPSLLDGAAYAARLGATEHATDAAALAAAAVKAGKASPTCRSVYSGIRE